jgi:hypothetical protein
MMILGIHRMMILDNRIVDGKDMGDMAPMEYMVDICIGYSHFLVAIYSYKKQL